MSMDDQPSEEELRAAYEAEIKKIRIEQILLEQVVSLVNLGMRRTGLGPGTEDERDVGQVRIAIEAVRALLPLIEQSAPPQASAIRDALSQLQLAYLRLNGGARARRIESAPVRRSARMAAPIRGPGRAWRRAGTGAGAPGGAPPGPGSGSAAPGGPAPAPAPEGEPASPASPGRPSAADGSGSRAVGRAGPLAYSCRFARRPSRRRGRLAPG